MAKVCFHVLAIAFLCAVALLARISEAISRPTSIVLENNEFKHILVAIDDNVDDDPALVQKIKVRYVCIYISAGPPSTSWKQLPRTLR